MKKKFLLVPVLTLLPLCCSADDANDDEQRRQEEKIQEQKLEDQRLEQQRVEDKIQENRRLQKKYDDEAWERQHGHE